jgi:hypothetical protein
MPLARFGSEKVVLDLRRSVVPVSVVPVHTGSELKLWKCTMEISLANSQQGSVLMRFQLFFLQHRDEVPHAGREEALPGCLAGQLPDVRGY